MLHVYTTIENDGVVPECRVWIGCANPVTVWAPDDAGAQLLDAPWFAGKVADLVAKELTTLGHGPVCRCRNQDSVAPCGTRPESV